MQAQKACTETPQRCIGHIYFVAFLNFLKGLMFIVIFIYLFVVNLEPMAGNPIDKVSTHHSYTIECTHKHTLQTN